ncbi:CBS domain-containing protein [Planotetraspora sp. A-T 1434]|uniref:CBS domain-containing protein n=1 Tax=Planotetraspora sp. A-T 1434 TaxID=2979219 RepID=UPI0021BE58E8|nr:CBS domain-containing protein [Planotetraspora sp. A-T 1434]MCT9930445.1 CBS domain-containing protein [Planotetraspora sp. A-T 1434]
MSQRVEEIMTPVPVALPEEAPIVKAAKLMRDQGIGDVLVVRGDQLCGLVTDRDIVVRAVAEARDVSATPVGTLCTSELITVTPDQDADEVIRLMRQKAVRRVPVVADGRPIGIVTLGDMALERDPASALSDISAASPNS